MYTLRLKHIQYIILDRKIKCVSFSINWIGYKLRDLNFNFPHSHPVSLVHKKCLNVLNIFKDKCSDSVLGQHSTKHLYNLLLDSDDHVIKIVERHVDIDYSVLFKNISDIY